ncbi:MAG TPA: DUF6542 domain-containing protein [Streptosporangiaceae bacterium]
MTQTRVAGRNAPTQGQSRRTRSGSITLTGRGAAVALFAACFLSLLIAAWTGWGLLADALFVMTCGLVTCYTRASGLRSLVVCPPLIFLAGSILAQAITAADALSAAVGILVTLGTSAPWLFTGTGLTVVIALGRGWRPELAALAHLRKAVRDIRPRGGRWIERR